METKDKKFAVVGGLVVIILLFIDVSLANFIFSKNHPKGLSGLDLSPVNAASLALTNKEYPITWEGPKNILILGRAGEGNSAPDLTDTIIVAHVDPSEEKIGIKLVSIPRDLFVKLDNEREALKINGLFSYYNGPGGNVEFLKEKIKEITSLNIDSVLVFDLETVHKIVKEIGGVTVFVSEDIYDPQFPTLGGEYETFSLKTGWRYLSADEAIKFIRTRHSPRGDFDRINHQQELLKAIKGKLVSINPFWNFPTLWSIFSSVKDNILTDLSLEDIKNLWNISQKVEIEDFEAISIDPSTNLVVPSTANIGGTLAYIIVAKDNSFDYSKIREFVREFINE